MTTVDISPEQDLQPTQAAIRFSAELLRIALLTLAALGGLLLKISERDFDDVTGLCMEFLPTFLCLILCLSCALIHRLIATHSLASHLDLMQRQSRLAAEPDQDNDSFRQQSQQLGLARARHTRRSTLGRWSIGLSAFALVLGLILAAHPVIDALSTPVSSGESNAADTVIRTSIPAHPRAIR